MARIIFFNIRDSTLSGGFRIVDTPLSPVANDEEIALVLAENETPKQAALRYGFETPPLFHVGGVYLLKFIQPGGVVSDPYIFTELTEVRKTLRRLAVEYGVNAFPTIVTPLVHITASVLKAGYRQVYIQFNQGDYLEVSYEPNTSTPNPNYTDVVSVTDRTLFVTLQSIVGETE